MDGSSPNRKSISGIRRPSSVGAAPPSGINPIRRASTIGGPKSPFDGLSNGPPTALRRGSTYSGPSSGAGSASSTRRPSSIPENGVSSSHRMSISGSPMASAGAGGHRKSIFQTMFSVSENSDGYQNLDENSSVANLMERRTSVAPPKIPVGSEKAYLDNNGMLARDQSGRIIKAGIKIQNTEGIQRCTKIILCSVLGMALVAAAVIGSVIAFSGREWPAETSVCGSSACSAKSKVVLNSMNETVDPCEDFYQFSCGSYINNTVIPDDMTSFSPWSELSRLTQESMKKIYESTFAEDSSLSTLDKLQDLALFNKMSNFYSSCINETILSSKGTQPMTDLLRRIYLEEMGGRWNELTAATAIGTALANAHRRRVDVFWKAVVDADAKDSKKHIFWLWNVDAFLPLYTKKVYAMEKAYTAYKNTAYSLYRTYLSPVINPTMNDTELRIIVDDMLNFEMRFINASFTRSDIGEQSKMYNVVEVNEASVILNSINFATYYNALFPSDQFNSSVTAGTTKISLDVPLAYRSINTIFQTASKATIQNYILFVYTIYYMEYLGRDQRKSWDPVKEALNIPTAEPERWKTCVQRTDRAFGHYSGRFFVKSIQADANKQFVMDMVRYVQAAYISRANLVPWLDVPTIYAIQDKIRAMGQKIAYSDDIMNVTKMTERHASVNVVPGEFFFNMLTYNTARNSENRRLIRELRNKAQWDQYPQTVNAFYSAPNNEFILLSAVMRGGLFDQNNPASLNYGSLGFIVGHEIMHGLDSDGRNYDQNGELKDWWSSYAKEEYSKRETCYIDQYNNYTVKVSANETIPLNGKLTLQENIADNGGLIQAYEAWKNHTILNPGKNFYLQGLEKYSHQQLFFIGFAQSFCATYRPSAIKLRVNFGVHSIESARINGAVSNFDTFAKTFNCKAGTKMNPQNKCRIL